MNKGGMLPVKELFGGQEVILLRLVHGVAQALAAGDDGDLVEGNI